MNQNELLKCAREAKKGINTCTNTMTLVLPFNFKRPKGFPRGELLSETERGRVYSFDPDKIIKWLAINNLISS